MIRRATIEDAIIVSAWAQELHSLSEYASIPFNRGHLCINIINALASQYSALFVACDDETGEACGYIWANVTQHVFNNNAFMVQEQAFYVRPDHRTKGYGRGLIQACLDWSKSIGACGFLSCALRGDSDVARLEQLYLDMGFSPFESVYWYDHVGRHP